MYWLCDPIACSLPGSSVHGISQARKLEWVAISFSRGFSEHRDWTGSPALQADSLLSETSGKQFFSFQFSCSVLLDSVTPWTAACQATLSITNSQSLLKLMSSLDWWCHPTISSSVISSSCIQSFLASGSFLMSQFFASGGQSIRASASTSVLSMNIQDWFLLRLTGLISLQSKELSSLLQHHSSKASILQCSAFFVVQLLHPWASLVAQLVKNLPAMWETWVPSLGWDPLEKRKGTHSSTLVFWPGEFHGLYSPGGHRVRRNWDTFTFSHLYMTTGKTIALTIQTHQKRPEGPALQAVNHMETCLGAGSLSAPPSWLQTVGVKLATVGPEGK